LLVCSRVIVNFQSETISSITMAVNLHGTSPPKVVHFWLVALLLHCSHAMGDIQHSHEPTCNAETQVGCSTSGQNLLQINAMTTKSRSINGVPVHINNGGPNEDSVDAFGNEDERHDWVGERKNGAFFFVNGASYNELGDILKSSNRQFCGSKYNVSCTS